VIAIAADRCCKLVSTPCMLNDRKPAMLHLTAFPCFADRVPLTPDCLRNDNSMPPRSDGFPAVRRDQVKVPAAEWAMPYAGSPALPHDLLKPAPAGLQAFYPGGAKATLTKGALCVLLAATMHGCGGSCEPHSSSASKCWLSSGIQHPRAGSNSFLAWHAS